MNIVTPIYTYTPIRLITDDCWPFILVFFSFVLAFIVTKIKKIIGKAKYVIIGFYSFIPLVVDLCFRRDRDIYYSSLFWIFAIVAVCWILLRYEVDKYIKK